MKVRFLKVYREFGTAWHPGEVTKMAEKDALQFIERGVVEKVDEALLPMCAITIPLRLQETGKRFIRMERKNPIDHDFPRTARYEASDNVIVDWIKAGNNYGVLGGDGLLIIDADTEELKQLIGKLPETFTVQSPGSKGLHCYYKCKLSKSIRLKDKDKNPVGEIQYTGKCVVGPNSIHPNGGRYEVIKDLPIAEISEELLRSTFSDYIRKDKKKKATTDEPRRVTPGDGLDDIDIRSVISISRLTKYTMPDEYYGEHPIHGSKNEEPKNFWVNVRDNVWHCFRHDSGGGPLQWLAVENGIIRCEDAEPGCLRGADFLKVLEIARKKGLVKDVKIPSQKKKAVTKGIWKKKGDGENGRA